MDPAGQNSTTSHPLFNLPTELFLAIWDDLPTVSRVCLVLTCRRIYTSSYSSILDAVSYKSAETRLRRLYLLRQLRKDISRAASPFLCHACLKFHWDPAPTGPPCDSGREQNTAMTALGFPYCNSAYASALVDARALVEVPSSRTSSSYEGECLSDPNMRYYTRIHVPNRIRPDRRPYIFTRHTYADRSVVESSTPRYPDQFLSAFLASLRRTNIDFCKHLYLGEDFVPGDGSLSDRLSEIGIKKTTGWGKEWCTGWWTLSSKKPEFHCAECDVVVEVTNWCTGRFSIGVWQHLNVPVTEGD